MGCIQLTSKIKSGILVGENLSQILLIAAYLASITMKKVGIPLGPLLFSFQKLGVERHIQNF